MKGTKGELNLNIPQQFDLQIDDNAISVVPTVMETIKKKEIKDLQGISMVKSGFEKTLLLKGIGYKAQMEGEKLILNLGYSQPIQNCL